MNTLPRILLALSIFSLLLFAYPVWRLGTWMQLSDTANIIITTPLFLSQFIARVGLRHSAGRLAFVFRGAADFFLGLAPFLLVQVVAAEFLLQLIAIPTQNITIAILISTTLIALWGVYKAWHPELVVVPLTSFKVRKNIRFAQISDVHIGSRSSRFLRNIIACVEQQNPDFLCITGDFIDQRGITVEKLAALKILSVPIYFCIGNHERYEDLDDIILRLETLGVEVLRNRSIEVDGIQFIGIDDHGNPKQVGRVLPFIDIKKEMYCILLYHRPHGLEDAQAHGVDLMLCGHTHAGQIMPFHLAVNKVFEYTSGLYHFKNTQLYVNEGTGTWGPTLRLGTRSEITLFELTHSG